MKQKLISILSVAAMALILGGTVVFLLLTNRIPGLPVLRGSEAADPEYEKTDLSLVVRDYSELEALKAYTKLQRLDLSGSTCYGDIQRFISENPQLQVSYCLFLTGEKGECRISNNSELLELDDASLVALLPEYSVYLPGLRELCLQSSGCSAADIAAFRSAFPAAELFIRPAPDWERVPLSAETLNLAELPPEYVENVLGFLPLMDKLTEISFTTPEGLNSLSPQQLLPFINAAPNVRMDYSFTLFGVNININDELVEFYGNSTGYIYDSGLEEIEAILPCMTKLQRLYFEFCEIEYDTLASFRDRHPELQVAWRILFGPYSCTTDREMIYADGSLNTEYCYNLRYCSGCRYLDLGHNPDLDNIDFVRGMPNLEVAIFAGDSISDLSPLAECKNLKYLEIFTTHVTDLSPLAACTELEHLNISCLEVRDISPLYGLTKLERLWCTRNRVPEQQENEIQLLMPGCLFCFSNVEPTGDVWRFYRDGSRVPDYDEIYWIFGYENWRDNISYW